MNSNKEKLSDSGEILYYEYYVHITQFHVINFFRRLIEGKREKSDLSLSNP